MVKTKPELERAKAEFEAFHLKTAYEILRRFYDRIPFAAEEEHSEYIGIFVRTLIELGKEREITFYMSCLERAYETNPAPYIGYPLAMLYFYLPQPKLKRAKEILEKILSVSSDELYRAKAKMLLAYYYEGKDDFGAIHALISSIEGTPSDPVVASILGIWKASLEQYSKNFKAAETILKDLLVSEVVCRNWYLYFSTKIALAEVHAEQGDFKTWERIFREIEKRFAGFPPPSLAKQMESLQASISKMSAVDTEEDAKEVRLPSSHAKYSEELRQI